MTHYFSEKQETPFKLGMLLIKNLRGIDMELYTAPGIFSWKRLDSGTRVLIEHMKIKPGDRVLDIGCGIGVVGIAASKLGADVTLSDTNERAIAVTRMNLKKLDIKAKAVKSHLFSEIHDSFDVIVSNPPISAGIALCYNLIEQSKAHLNPGGSLQLVAKRNIAGRRFMQRMLELFGNCEVLAKSGGYWVYYSIKNDK